MKIALQVILIVLSLIPAVFGTLNTVIGPARFIPQEVINPALDSQFRFQSVYYMGLAVLVWWMVRKIEHHSTLFAIVIMTLFVGGLARAYSYFVIGTPPAPMFYAMFLELALPVLIPWQRAVAGKYPSQ